VCVDLYDARSGLHEHGAVVHRAEVPAYFDALLEARSIAANDAALDPRTREFAPHYLPRHGIGAMLDAPVLVRGSMVGVVCHEHVGGPRRWEFWEELLAATMADFMALAIEADESKHWRQQVEAERAHQAELDERTAALKEENRELQQRIEVESA